MHQKQFSKETGTSSTTSHHSQNAFVKGRSILDAVRTINDILEFEKRNNRNGILVAIDFEKAFDSLNRKFLLKASEKFNFGAMDSEFLHKFIKLCFE